MQESFDLLETLHDSHLPHSPYTGECDADQLRRHRQSVTLLATYSKAISTTLYERDNREEMFRAVREVSALVCSENNEVPYR